jgi:hypothetical protein
LYNINSNHSSILTYADGKGGVLSSLNQILFTIRRLSNHIHLNKLKEIADSIRVSKLRYGLQLYSEVRTTNFTNIERAPKITKQTSESLNRKKSF